MEDKLWREETERAPRMIDIHVHIVPGVDDGARDLDMALKLARLERAQGVCGIIATPHSSGFDWFPEKARLGFEQLKARLAAEMPDLPLALGCEVRCSPERMEEILARLSEGGYPSMNATRYVLTEFSTQIYPDEAQPCVEALLGAGWKPILAHVERYGHLFEEDGQSSACGRWVAWCR